MSVKRVIVPTITMLIIASQLMGCSSVSQSEMLQMINQGDAIEIEVAVPLNQEQGTEKTVEWTQLDQLTSQPELRSSMENIFKIVAFGDNSKNGVFYVNLDGEQDGNNTLYNVFANNKFREGYWNNVAVQRELAQASAENYADIDYEEGNYKRAMLAGINGYFNILNDSETGFANMDSTITRLEAMSALFKAENPVTDTLSEDSEFREAVDAGNTNEYTIFASNLSEQSYLDISSGSLDSHTANGTITRGELVYMIVQEYFKTEYDNVDIKGECYADTVNGGNIAVAQKFIEGENKKEHWQSYELSYALQNPDKGCPERMYKALLVANEKGIIVDKDSRWEEGATKEDFLEMLTNAYLALPSQVSAERGTGEAPVQSEAPTTEHEETGELGNGTSEDAELETPEDVEYQNQLDNELAEETKDQSDVISTDIEILDKTMYAKGSVNTRSGPSTDYEKLGGLTTNQEVHVTGQSKETGWYEIEINGSKQYVSNQFLSDTKTQVTQASTSNSGQQSNQGTTQNNNSNNTSQGNSNGTVNTDGSLNLDKLKELGFGKHDLPASSGSAAGLGNNSSGNWNDVTIY